MKEDINAKIIKKLRESDYDKNVIDFLIEMIREEFNRGRTDANLYETAIEKYINAEKEK